MVSACVTVLSLCLLLVGCSPHILHPAALAKSETTFQPLPDSSETLIGVALSGGGSRAAYFGAAGLEALADVRVGADRRSLLEQITHMSSVSGGSVASSYFASRKPPATVPVFAGDTISSQYRAFFDQYREAMAANIQWGIEWRQVIKTRWLSSPNRAASLAEVLDRSYLKGMTLADLYVREQRRDVPQLILNSTLYNNGRRVVMTTVPAADFKYDFIHILQDQLKAKHGGKPLPPSLRVAEQALMPNTFEEYGIDARHIPISYAVAASASFPFFIGPISVVSPIYPDTYLHVGDGGLFDNQGTESLLQVFLKKLEGPGQGAVKRGLVVAFDSSFPFWIQNTTLDHLKDGFKVFVDDPTRIVGIMEQRANAYQVAMWHILQTEGIVLPADTVLKVIVIRHTDLEIWPEQSEAVAALIPDACGKEREHLRTREQVREHLAMIATKFKLPSACDRAILQLAAKRGVARFADEIRQFLGQQ